MHYHDKFKKWFFFSVHFQISSEDTMKSSTTPEAQRKVQKAAVTNSLKPTSTGSMSPNSSSCPQVRKSFSFWGQKPYIWRIITCSVTIVCNLKRYQVLFKRIKILILANSELKTLQLFSRIFNFLPHRQIIQKFPLDFHCVSKH